MGKASRNKKLKRQQAANIERYGGVKLSEALMNVCDPYDYDDLSLAEYKKLIGMTSVAWNVARLDENKRAEYLFDFVKKMPDSINILTILRSLIQRKDELYPNDDRVIVDFDIKETANERHLFVSSAIPGTHDKSFLA